MKALCATVSQALPTRLLMKIVFSDSFISFMSPQLLRALFTPPAVPLLQGFFKVNIPRARLPRRWRGWVEERGGSETLENVAVTLVLKDPLRSPRIFSLHDNVSITRRPSINSVTRCTGRDLR